jgi:protein SCO1/2
MKRWKLQGIVFCILGLLLAHSPQPVLADHSSPNPLQDAGFEQKLNAQVPLGLSFRDEAGRSVRLGEYFGKKPVILFFAYYECPMLCSLVMNDLTKTLQELIYDAGNQFEVITVSMDPGETPELAAAKKAVYLQEYGRPGAETGWHFLTGEQAEIHQLADAVGFRYVYDEEKDQYAHPAGIMVITPEGKVSRYFPGIDYSAVDLRLGLVEASQQKIASPVDQFFLLCYAYDPVTGRYTIIVEKALRLGGIATVAALGTAIGVLFWRERRLQKNSITTEHEG